MGRSLMVGPPLAAALWILALSSGSAAAAPGYSLWQMNCREAQAVVAAQGAVVMYTTPASRSWPETFERFVRHDRYCMAQETVEPAWAPTRDNKTCMVGYRCVHLDIPRLPEQ